MNSKLKKHILKNINYKSTKEISTDLNIPEADIENFLRKNIRQQEPQSKPQNLLSKKFIIFSIIFVIILGALAYSTAYNGEFIWDDRALIVENSNIKNWSNISKIFTENIYSGVGISSNFYRPLQMLTYMVDYFLWGNSTCGYHFTNVALHILAALCVFWFVQILFENPLLSLLTAAFFVVHPIHTEAVSYISGRSDPMALCLMLLTFIFYINCTDINKFRTCLIIGVSYALALLSRETTLILPVLILTYHYTFRKKIAVTGFITIIGVAAVYMLSRSVINPYVDTNMAKGAPLLQRLPGFFVALENYIKLLVLPLNLHMEYGSPIFKLSAPAVILTFVLSLFYALRKNTSVLIKFSILWFFITLFPVSNIIPVNAYMAEHWLYVPSIGFFLLLANGLTKMYYRKNLKWISIMITGLFLISWMFLTLRQNEYWKDKLTFYKRTLTYSPKSYRIVSNFGIFYQENGKYPEAIELYKKAIEIDPKSAAAYNNLGSVYYIMRNYNDAIICFKKALELNPNLREAQDSLKIITETS